MIVVSKAVKSKFLTSIIPIGKRFKLVFTTYNI